MKISKKEDFEIKAASVLLPSLIFALLYLIITPAIAFDVETTIILTTSDDWHYGVISSGLAAATNHAMVVNHGFDVDKNIWPKMEGFDKLIIVGNLTVVSFYSELKLNSTFRYQKGHWPLSIERVSGGDIYETSANLADMWPEPQGIIVTRSDVFADALVATQLSAAMKAPILFTDSNTIPDVILNK